MGRMAVGNHFVAGKTISFLGSVRHVFFSDFVKFSDFPLEFLEI